MDDKKIIGFLIPRSIFQEALLLDLNSRFSEKYLFVDLYYIGRSELEYCGCLDMVFVQASEDAEWTPLAVMERVKNITDARIIIIGCSDQSEIMFSYMELGAYNLFFEDDHRVDDLIELIEKNGDHAFHSKKSFGYFFAQNDKVPAEVNLTPREIEIVKMIAEHLSNQQIAEKLLVSIYTVKNHIHNIIGKLEADDRDDAAYKFFHKA